MKPTPIPEGELTKCVRFDAVPAVVERLDRLQRLTGAASWSEVIRFALFQFDRSLEAAPERTPCG